MHLFKNNWTITLSSQLVIGIIGGIVLCKWWCKTLILPNPKDISLFPSIFGSNVYTPCKCGFPHPVCNECNDTKLSINFPVNVLLFSKSIKTGRKPSGSGGVSFMFYTPLTIENVEDIALQLEITVPIQYGTVMIHYTDVKYKKTLQELNLVWCAHTSPEAKTIFPMVELLSRIVQIQECSQALGYEYKPITSMLIHDIDVYL